ncbi:MAG: hypothetical protein Q8P18_26040 [Pseudomonadota bacterium]|nr:hypothetical protein [Pseudomonadota bacterium]
MRADGEIRVASTGAAHTTLGSALASTVDVDHLHRRGDVVASLWERGEGGGEREDDC